MRKVLRGPWKLQRCFSLSSRTEYSDSRSERQKRAGHSRNKSVLLWLCKDQFKKFGTNALSRTAQGFEQVVLDGIQRPPSLVQNTSPSPCFSVVPEARALEAQKTSKLSKMSPNLTVRRCFHLPRLGR